MRPTSAPLFLALAAQLVISQSLAAPSPQVENSIHPADIASLPVAVQSEPISAPSPVQPLPIANEAPKATTTTTITTTTTTPVAPKETISTTPGEDDSSNFEFTSNQNTSTFTCEGKVTGYYADVKLNCRVYHFCTQLDALEGPAYQRMSYLCLEGSFFDQKDLNCVKESDMKVPCDKAEAEFEKSNKQFDAKEETPPSMSDNIAANIMMNPITRFIAGR